MPESIKEIEELRNKVKTLEEHEANFKNLLLRVFGIETISEETAKGIVSNHKPLGNYLVIGEDYYKVIDNTKGNTLVAVFEGLEKAFTFLKTEIFVEVLQKNDKKTS